MDKTLLFRTISGSFTSSHTGGPMAMKPRRENDFSRRLRELRDKRGLSQTDLGKLVNVHYTHIGRYEAGRAKPTAATLQSLAEALGVTTDFLMSGATTELASARLTDRELLARFQDIERLPDDDKLVVKKLLDAFLAMHQLKAYANKQAI
jgi:transcriptional regulator with XRE-family HTH domain